MLPMLLLWRLPSSRSWSPAACSPTFSWWSSPMMRGGTPPRAATETCVHRLSHYNDSDSLVLQRIADEGLTIKGWQLKQWLPAAACNAHASRRIWLGKCSMLAADTMAESVSFSCAALHNRLERANMQSTCGASRKMIISIAVFPARI